MSWLGTPYHHQASAKGVGCDCLGLVRGVWRALYGDEPEAMPGYSRDWSMGEETMLDGARRHLVEIAPGEAMPGDVLLFRYRPHLPAKHAGIAIVGGEGELRFVHAWDAVPRVCSSILDGWWRRRIAAAFSFPGVV